MSIVELWQRRKIFANLSNINTIFSVKAAHPYNYSKQRWTSLFRAFSSHRQPSASLTKLFPSCCGFFITKIRETNRTQHVTIVFNVTQF